MKTTIETFRAFESDGLVRLRAFPETESYFDVYGEPDSAQERQEIIDQIDLHGCWFVESYYFAEGQWHHADSVGMCVYARPLDPTENWYVEDLMRSAVRALEMQSTEGALI
jgi:alpha-amylase/alpha-mannosidase (GH57 family)